MSSRPRSGIRSLTAASSASAELRRSLPWRRLSAALVDGQVDVVRVAGVDPVGDDGQFAAELGDERAMVGGDAGLGAVVSHQRLTLAPAHELVVEVGVSVGADHGDVAGAKLGGQGAEDAHLKVAAVQPAGLAAAAQDLLPLL